MSTVNLNWPANPVGELVTEYKVHESVDGGTTYNLRGTVPTNQITISDLPTGEYLWKVVAVNLAGDSPDSNAAASPGVPSKPGDITVTVS